MVKSDYVAPADADCLVRLLSALPMALEGDDTRHGWQHIHSSHSPARLAYAEAGDLVYTFGRNNYVTPPRPWSERHCRTPAERELCTLLRRMAAELTRQQLQGTSHVFNYVLIQKYDGPATFLSFHRDASNGPAQSSGLAGQVHGTPVASLSLGAARVFAFTSNAYAYESVVDQFGLRLLHGSLLVMDAACNERQRNGGLAHALLMGSGDDEDATRNGGVRFNLTFRVMQQEDVAPRAVSASSAVAASPVAPASASIPPPPSADVDDAATQCSDDDGNDSDASNESWLELERRGAAAAAAAAAATAATATAQGGEAEAKLCALSLADLVKLARQHSVDYAGCVEKAELASLLARHAVPLP